MTNSYPIKPLAVSAINIPTTHGELDGNQQPLVDARDLHQFLNVGRDFNTWIKSRIDDYGFAENSDFTCSPISGSGKNQGLNKFSPKLGKTSTGFFGGHNRIDYHISLDMAKELAMVERNDKGRQARRYFIAMEKQAIADAQSAKLSQQSWQIDDLQDAYLAAKPEHAKLIRYYSAGNLSNVEIAKLMGIHNCTVSRHLRVLSRLGLIIYPRPDDYTQNRQQHVLSFEPQGDSHAE